MIAEKETKFIVVKEIVGIFHSYGRENKSRLFFLSTQWKKNAVRYFGHIDNHNRFN